MSSKQPLRCSLTISIWKRLRAMFCGSRLFVIKPDGKKPCWSSRNHLSCSNPMKFLKIAVFISVGLIITAGVILAVFLALFDIEHYKPRITQELSSLSGRDVQIDQLRLDFKIDKGLSIAIKGLSIADDPAFSRDKALAVDSIYLNMDLLALIFQRQIAIAQIEISGPRVYLVRNKEGLLNVQTLLERNVNGDAMGGNLQPNSAPAAASPAPAGPPDKTERGRCYPVDVDPSGPY